MGFTCFVDGYFAGEVERAIKRFKRDYTPSHAVHASYDLSKNPNTGDFDKDMLLALDEALVEDKLNYTEFNWAKSELGLLIAQQESRKNYALYNQKVIAKNGSVSYPIVMDDSLIDCTLAEVVDRTQDTTDIHAAGGFQMKHANIKSAVTFLSLNPKEAFFSEAIQDRIFNEYIIDRKRTAVMTYLEGENDNVSDAMYELAKEFASMPVEAGKKLSNGDTAQGGESYYEGDGANKVHGVTVKDFRDILIDTKTKQTAGFSEK